jgi:hypothetical protein
MWFEEHCEYNNYGRIPKEWIVKESKMPDKEVIRGMTRMGLKYNKELKGMGCRPFSKEYYKGGFIGCKIKEVEVEVATDDENE